MGPNLEVEVSSSFSLKYMILYSKNSILILFPQLPFLPTKLNLL